LVTPSITRDDAPRPELSVTPLELLTEVRHA
jgi:hypothetical protein